jgi:hypothetical protein
MDIANSKSKQRQIFFGWNPLLISSKSKLGFELLSHSEVQVKIQIRGRAIAGKVAIPPGEYLVAVLTDRSAIQLTGTGSEYVIPAVNRRNPAMARIKATTVTFHSLGGTAWTLGVALPKRGEWVAFLQIERETSVEKPKKKH